MRRAVLLLLLSLPLHAQQAGRLTGRIVDVTNAPVPALIGVVEADRGAVVQRLSTDSTGAFTTNPLPPGTYSLTAHASGFRRRDLHTLTVRSGETADAGAIQLDVASCDSPGVICDYFGPPPEDVKRIVERQQIELKLASTVDLDPPGQSDLGLTRDDNGALHLTALNSAKIASPDNSAGDCRHAKWTEARLAITGLGPGIDFCVKTKRGNIAHAFFTEDVDPTAGTVHLWYVTRRPH